MLAMLLLLLVNGAYSSESYVVHGSVSNLPHGGFPITHITATCMIENDVVGTATTDENGQYTLSFGFVGVAHLESHSHALRVFPNPYGRQTTLQAVLPQADHYTLEVSDISGRVLIQQKMFLEAGQQHILLQDEWGKGMRIFHLFSSNYSSRAKGIQSSAAQGSGSFEVLNTKNNVKAQSGRPIQLSFESENHYTYDTIIDFAEIPELQLNVSLQQQKQWQQASLLVEINNNPMQMPVEGVQADISNEHEEPLYTLYSDAQGSISYSIERGFYAHAGDTMPDYQMLYITLSKQHHTPGSYTVDYAQNIHLEAELEQIAQEQTANITVNATNNPMNQNVQELEVMVYDNNNNFLGQYNNTFEINRTFYEHAGDTLPSYEYLTFILKAPHHQNDTITKNFSNNIHINSTMMQIPQQKQATTNLEYISQPLGHGPNLEIYFLNQEDTLMQTNTVNGQQTTHLNYNKYTNGQNTLTTINGEPITNLTILASNNKHQEQENTIPFQEEMNLQAEIQQTPQQGTTTITTNLTGNIFGEAPNNVSIQYKNNETNEELTQSQTTNGQNITELQYQYWEHNDLYHQDLNEIKQTITKTGVYETLTHTLNNEDQTTNYTLTQIPEEKTAQIIGTVKNTTQEPIQNANIKIKNEETEYAATTTTTNGTFETNIQYTQYVNPENVEEKITTPENIYAKISKPEYETHTTETKNLEDLINFGEITLTPEPTTITFKIQPYTATHKHINQITNEPFKFLIRTTSDNQIHEFTQNGTNPIEITFTEYTPNEEIKIWHNNPEQKFDQTIFFENTQGQWTDPTIAQNRIVREWTPGMAMDTTTTTLGHLGNPEWNEHIDAYFPEHLLYSTEPQINLTFSGDTIMTMLADRTGYTNLIKNWKHQSIPHVDDITFTFFRDPNNPWDNSHPIPEEDIQTIHAIKQNQDQYLTSPSGKVRMQVNYTLVSSQEDAQEFINRNWDYTHNTWYEGGQPLNSVQLDVPNQRIRYASARFPLQSIQGDIYEEIEESKRASGNGPGNKPSKTYTVKLGENGYLTPNDVGITMTVMQTGLNSWTPVISWNKDTGQTQPHNNH